MRLALGISYNGQAYNGVMPPQGDVLTYVANSWGNTAEAFAVDEIRKVKGE